MKDTANDVDFRISETEHACYYKGKRQPSVGTILRKAASVFNPWAKDDVTPEARARMDRGKTIHETLALHDQGVLAEHEYDPQCDPYIKAWGEATAYLRVPKWDVVEAPRFSADLGVWGILDRAVSSQPSNLLPLVADIKTGTARPASYRIQVAGYCMLFGATLGVVVYLSDTGLFDPERDVERATEADFQAFEMAVKLAKR